MSHDDIGQPILSECRKRGDKAKLGIGQSKPAHDGLNRQPATLEHMNDRDAKGSDRLLMTTVRRIAAEPAAHCALIGSDAFREIFRIKTNGLEGREDVVWPQRTSKGFKRVFKGRWLGNDRLLASRRPRISLLPHGTSWHWLVLSRLDGSGPQSASSMFFVGVPIDNDNEPYNLSGVSRTFMAPKSSRYEATKVRYHTQTDIYKGICWGENQTI